jgi:hypothetical protein
VSNGGVMSDYEADPTRPPLALLKTLDAVFYAVAVTLAVAVPLAALSLLLYGDLVGLKYALFFLGFLTFGLGAFKIQPARPWEGEDAEGGMVVSNSRSDSRFQRAVHRVPPLDRYTLHDHEQLSDGAKFLLAGVAMLVASFLLERLFGVVV